MQAGTGGFTNALRGADLDNGPVLRFVLVEVVRGKQQTPARK